MSCSRSVSVHLLRGLGAVLLVVAAFTFGKERFWLLVPMLVGAVILLGGCPACWLAGLFETIGRRGDALAPRNDGPG